MNLLKLNRRTSRTLFIVLAALAIVAMACVCSGLGNLTPGTSTVGGPDGGDGYSTTGGGSITVGGSQSATLNSLFEAHNWSFQGTSGQTVTISAVAQGDTDPRVKLLDANGNIIAEDDDSGGGTGGRDAFLTATLPADGTYYIRIDVFTTGTYTVTLQ